MATLQDLPGIIRRAVRGGCNLHCTGNPGMGKTAVIEQTVAAIQAEDPEFGYWNLYTPSLSPGDFAVPMPDQMTGTLRMYNNEALPNGRITPDARGILFLGERDNADPATNKALQKYINNESMGSLIKPRGVIVVSDSNDINHRSGAVQQSLALLSRSRVVPIQADVEGTLKYFGEIGVYPYVQAYLSLRKEHVDTFETVLKDRSYRVWANPRAWERLAKSLEDAEEQGEVLSAEEIIGDVGEAVGREFVAFMYATKELVSYEEIARAPATTHKPEKLSDVYAVIAMLGVSVKPEHMAAIKEYVCRFPMEVRVLFLRMMATSKGKNREANCRTKAYTEWFSDKNLRAALGV